MIIHINQLIYETFYYHYLGFLLTGGGGGAQNFSLPPPPPPGRQLPSLHVYTQTPGTCTRKNYSLNYVNKQTLNTDNSYVKTLAIVMSGAFFYSNELRLLTSDLMLDR